MARPQGLQRHRMQQSQFLVRLAQPALVDMHGRDVPPQGLGKRVARSLDLLGQFACALERGQRRVGLAAIAVQQGQTALDLDDQRMPGIAMRLQVGDGGDVFKEAFNTRILPALRNFAPDIVFISAGFDAHQDDPLANLRLVEPDFSWATSKIAELADTYAQGRLVSMLEGGYNLNALARSVGVHVRALMQAGS